MEKHIKIILIFFLFTGISIKIFLCNDSSSQDNDITIEDESSSKNEKEIEIPQNEIKSHSEDVYDSSEHISTHKPTRPHPFNEDSEEFDDPILLQQKNGIKNPPMADRNVRKNIPTPGIDQTQEELLHNQTPPPVPEQKFFLAYYEMAMIGFLLIFLINCYWGKSYNEKLATRWYRANRKFFEDNYAHIGAGTEYNPKTCVPLIKDSYNGFKFYASGRVYTKWMLVNMEFKKRQDLVSVFSSMFISSEKDKVVYETSLSPPNELPFVFCLCRKKDVKAMKKNYSDIDFFTEPVNFGFMSESLVFLNEASEILDPLFTDRNFKALYLTVEPFIDMIYFTDRKTYTKEQHTIFFSFDLPHSHKDSDELMLSLTLFVHTMIDMLCEIKITASYKKEAERKRIEHDQIKAKELAEKNAEENKQKKDEKQKTSSKKVLTREQAQKIDEKEKKESLKTQKKKMMKVIKN